MAKGNYGAGANGLMNLNGNLLVSMDTETTGLVAGHNDIIEVGMVPLGADLRPLPDVMPFQALIKPKDRYADSWTEEAAKVHGITREELALHGEDPYRAGERFEAWFEKLCLGDRKKLAPLAKNWPFDRGFIEDWLCPKTFNRLIWHRARDVGPVVLFLNDKAEFDGNKCPFPQTGLQDVRGRLGIPPNKAHRALQDALTTAEAYRRIVTGQYVLE